MEQGEVKDLLKKVRKLEIKVRRISEQHFIGDYKSAFKGSGLSFAEVRPYQYGDEVRNIDWNVTARTGSAYVKMFEEEREASVLLILDNSASMFFGSQNSAKRELATELAAVLAFSAVSSNDKIGLLMFDTNDITFIPPKKGRNQLLHILSAMMKADQPRMGQTDLGGILTYLMETKTKSNICFLISDFQSFDFSVQLKPVALKYDLVGIWVEDPAEKKFPVKGLVQLSDLETGYRTFYGNLFSKNKATLELEQKKHWEETKDLFHSSGADFLRFEVGKPYVPALQNYFKRRKK
nr:DUF58 domain-containing protein [Saprospiraceae bacterium]